MANKVDVNIRAADNASAAFQRFRVNAERETGRLHRQVGQQFKSLAANMVGSISGGSGMIVSSLGSIKHPAAIAAAAVAGVGIALVSMAKRAAEATKETDARSREFLNGIKNLQVGFENLVISIGQKVIPAMLKLFEFLGIETKTAAKTREEISKLHEEQKKHAEEIKQKYAELNEQARIAFGEGNRAQLLATVMAIADLRRETGGAKDGITSMADGMVRMRVVSTAAEGALRALVNVQSIIGGDAFSGVSKRLAENQNLIEDSLRRTIDVIAKIDEADLEDAYVRQNEELEKQKALHEHIRQQVGSTVASLGAAILSGQEFNRVLESIIMSFLRLGLQSLFGVPVPLGANGLIAMQHGSIVRRPTAAMIGEAGPEAVVPLSPGKARQRNEIMDAAGLSGGSVTLNISMPNIRSVDPITVRNVLLPEFNKQVRRGERLLSSKLR